jgi:hypothetical protein
MPARPRSESSNRERNQRGNSKDRAARKNRFLNPVSGWGGDTQTVPCVHCGTRVGYGDIQSDRKKPGGGYTIANTQPSCPTCNLTRSNNSDWVGPLSQGQFPRDVNPQGGTF